METYKLLVSLHNIVNLPSQLASGPTKSFTVSLGVGSRVLASDVSPEVTATFNTTTDLQVNDRLEAKLEGSGEWAVGSDVIDVIVTIHERDGSARGRVVAVSSPLRVAARDIVMDEKLATRIVGTSLGQVGVSFAVSPSDTEGYTRRLMDLLAKHNPKGQELVPGVVKAHGEVEAFTKVYKRYGVRDYHARVRDYFSVYGPDFLPQMSSLLSEWENREEELMRNLILDNGPELKDVDIKKRVVAMAEKYRIADLDPQAVASSGRPAAEVMAPLIARYGPEPDPRGYCFPAVFYNASSTPLSQPLADPSPTFGRPPAAPGSISRTGSMPRSTSANAETPSQAQRAPSAAHTPSGPDRTTGRLTSAMGATPAGPSAALVELWSRLCDDLRQSGVPLAELHYVNEASFDALLVELGYPPHIRAQLAAEWLRRVRTVLRQEVLSAGDSLYEAARRDILAIGNLLPLNVSVVGVVALRNTEHESSFSLRLSDAKVRASERLLMVGDYTKLLNVAVHGVNPSPQRSAPSAIFYRSPLSVFQKPTSVSVLVCDVVVGKAQMIPEVTSTPYDATADFLAKYDSCVYTDPVHGRAVAVYGPQQVLPRYIVHCNIDNSITPCPANPDRPVEYLVVENNAFACSQCVVMGQYRGKDVIPIEEAATQARTQLSEMLRDADALTHELVSEEEACAKALESINRGEIKENAMKMAEHIRREAEQRIQQLMLDAEEQERSQQHAVTQQKNRVHAVVLEAQAVGQMLQEKTTRSATSAIEALLHLRHNPPVYPVREKARNVLAGQAEVKNIQFAISQPRASLSASVVRPAEPPAANTSVAQAFGLSAPSRPEPAGPSAPLFAGRSQSAAASRPVDIFGTNNNNAAARSGLNSSTAVSQPPPQAQSANTVANGDLFSRYMTLKHNQQPQTQGLAQPHADTSHLSAAPAPAAPTMSTEARFNKEQMTKGWAEHRRGDKAAAHATWTAVYERNATNGTGARARAYIAEAIDRDYDEASHWYEKALALDPTDCMTLYNYGVLLETVMNRKREAINLFDTAFKHGDQTAGRRAQQLRTQLGL